ncbi:hypothetical protein [Streptomyces sp. NPDC055006]
MATKTVDVTLASMRNAGTVDVSPRGTIHAEIVRSVDDTQVFETELLYFRQDGTPIHFDGATRIAPGESLTYNVTKRLTVSHFEQETDQDLNQMLIFDRKLTQDVRDETARLHPDQPYTGDNNRRVLFDDIVDFDTIKCRYDLNFDGNTVAKLLVTYTVNLISSSG